MVRRGNDAFGRKLKVNDNREQFAMSTPIKMRKSEEIPWQEGDGFIYLDRDGARYKIEPHSRRGVILTICYQDGRGHKRQYASQAAAQVVVESKLRSARWVAAK